METLKLGIPRYSKKKDAARILAVWFCPRTERHSTSPTITTVEVSLTWRASVSASVSMWGSHPDTSSLVQMVTASRLTGPSRIVVFDTESEKIVRKIRTGARPKSIEISKDGQFIYSSDYRGHSLTIVDTKTYETKTIKLNILKSSGIAVHPDDSFVYITGWCTNDLWAIQRLKPGEEPPPDGKYRYNRPCYKCDHLRQDVQPLLRSDGSRHCRN